jgi:hypothetical protein
VAAKHTRVDDLTIESLTRMNLFRRKRREVWYPKNSAQTATQWLQQLFGSSYDDAHQLVRNRIGQEWDKIVRLLESLLKEKAVPAAPVKK